MATVLEESTKLTLTVQTGQKESGAAITANRSFNNISPELSNDDALSVMAKLSDLQKHEVLKMTRTDVSVLGE